MNRILVALLFAALVACSSAGEANTKTDEATPIPENAKELAFQAEINVFYGPAPASAAPRAFEAERAPFPVAPAPAPQEEQKPPVERTAVNHFTPP